MNRIMLVCLAAILMFGGAVSVQAAMPEKSEISLKEIQEMDGFYTESVQPSCCP